jgi:hypothetical protein
MVNVSINRIDVENQSFARTEYNRSIRKRKICLCNEVEHVLYTFISFFPCIMIIIIFDRIA